MLTRSTSGASVLRQRRVVHQSGIPGLLTPSIGSRSWVKLYHQRKTCKNLVYRQACLNLKPPNAFYVPGCDLPQAVVHARLRTQFKISQFHFILQQATHMHFPRPTTRYLPGTVRQFRTQSSTRRSQNTSLAPHHHRYYMKTNLKSGTHGS